MLVGHAFSVSDASPAAITITAHDGNEGQVTSTSGGLTFRTGDFFSGAEREHMRLTPEGQVGIGTADPQATLDVAGSVRAQDGIVFGDGTVLKSAKGLKGGATAGVSAPSTDPTSANASGVGTAGKISKWVDGAGTLGDSSVTDVNGQIGIGTSSPAAGSMLDVRGNISLSGAVPAAHASTIYKSLWLQNNVAVIAEAASGYSVISLGSNLQRTTPGLWGFVDPTKPAWRFALGSGPGFDQFTVMRSAPNAFNEISMFKIDATGNVGIGVGTAVPAAKLEVAGDIKVSGNAVVAGNIAAKYQDMAEWVPARQHIPAGTVVILDRRSNNTVSPSNSAYDTHVAGVISAQPGVILGEGGEGKVLVATTGRVKIKVDATRRPIRIGDLLVTSSRSGLAMRSLPIRVADALIHRPGTIIGKALEPLAKGRGEILVLLSLQ